MARGSTARPISILTEKTIRVETRTRAITRLWRATQVDIPKGTAAILLLSEDDYTIGLWSEQSGLVYETEEDFEPGASTEIKCFHTRDTLAKFITVRQPGETKTSQRNHCCPLCCGQLMETRCCRF